MPVTRAELVKALDSVVCRLKGEHRSFGYVYYHDLDDDVVVHQNFGMVVSAGDLRGAIRLLERIERDQET